MEPHLLRRAHRNLTRMGRWWGPGPSTTLVSVETFGGGRLGLAYGRVRVVESDPGWSRAFERLATELRAALGELLFVLEDRPAHRVGHVQAVPYGGGRWRRYLAFRDRLRADAEARAAYAELKRRPTSRSSRVRACA
jgi:GrpB-like predicted nucleotidyltransferase (UPF0157 family)